jgi:subtilisin
MPAKKPGTTKQTEPTISTSVKDLFVSAAERGDESHETGRYIITYKRKEEGAGLKHLKSRGLKVADAREFEAQAVTLEALSGADALHFPEIGAALVAGPAFTERMGVQAEGDSEAFVVEPEYFAFASNSEYLRGFVRAAQTISADLGGLRSEAYVPEPVEAESVGFTWGLKACKVPPSSQSGAGIRVAILDTGLDLGHPDFVGRIITSQTFVGQPVQDLHGHGTHTTGTACGTKAPAGTTPRYGIASGARIFVGKVLSNSGGGTTATVLAGMNWAIANKCEVISMSLGAQTPVQAAYTAAGTAALGRGLLMIAAAGNAASQTGAPGNSPSIMSVASLDQTLVPSSFSNFGKVEIAAPGRDVFSSVPMPRRYAIMSGTSMATPHVAGCAALWAQTSSSLRAMNLWHRLQATAHHLPFPPARVGAGLVQAP